MKMPDVSPELDKIFRHAFDSAQRITMQIAGKPLELREAAFALAEDSLREGFAKFGAEGAQVEAF